MLKKEARKIYRQQRLSLPVSQREKLDDLILIQFQAAEIPFIESLLSYWPIEENNEPNTHHLTEFLRFRNPELKVCYPVSDFEKISMRAVVTDIDTPFTKQELNIYEPAGDEIVEADVLDMVFVPLLAFDRQGYRVGYGKGFYDNYLSECNDTCIKVGFSYFDPLDAIEDRHEFDVPLDLCITPQSLYVF